MWGKKKGTSEQPLLGPGKQTDRQSGRYQIGLPFQLGTDLYDLADHPTIAGWQVMHDPRTVTVTLYRPGSGSIELGFANAVRGKWIGLVDEYGHRLPIELYRDHKPGVLFARWVEVFGDLAAGSGPQVSDDVRRRAAQDASEQQARTHASAMGIIFNIR